ncbi:phage minor capsid protein [Clostridium botulinum]|uniref:phage minor capsid protein n=1 Tax=Clostridium botulinum TaxID=1491 RepID=UPI001967693E|nr:phage minor capsid protein [Clostridium botulinum]MBN1050279.1 capsid protein [Clostridium botulinum]
MKKNRFSKLGDIIKNLTKNKILENAKREKEQSYDIRKIFEQMELDLISSMHKAFYFHKQEEEKEGFTFEQWQLSKLRSIEEYRNRNKKLVESYSKPIQRCIDRELNKRYVQGQNRFSRSLEDGYIKAYKKKLEIKESKVGLPEDIAEKQKTREYISKELGREITPPQDKDFFGMNDKKLDALQKVVEQDLKKAQYSVLRKMDDVYRQTIFKTHVYLQSGTKSLNQAIDMATKDFLNKGIDSITYKDGKKVNIASYAEMCLRTANHRATLLGEGKKRDEWGIHLVVVSAHDNTCKLCEMWQGKILIDDVFSQGSKNDGPYPLLSEAIEAGLLHPNCRHTLITFFQGITNIPVVPDEKEAIKTYEAEQKQRSYERALRKQKRIVQGTCDLKNKELEEIKLKLLERKLRERISNNKALRRNYNREKVRL